LSDTLSAQQPTGDFQQRKWSNWSALYLAGTFRSCMQHTQFYQLLAKERHDDQQHKHYKTHLSSFRCRLDILKLVHKLYGLKLQISPVHNLHTPMTLLWR
jgi:hypothetical protein